MSFKTQAETMQTIRDMIEIQGRDGNWNYDPYMKGLYNGMEFIASILENRQPIYKDDPVVWLKDVPKEYFPVACNELKTETKEVEI